MSDGDDQKTEETSGGDNVAALCIKISEVAMQRFFESTLKRKLSLLQDSLPFLDNRREKKRRLRLIQELYAAKIKLEEANDVFSLAFVDMGVEAIIEGDWKEVRQIAEHFTYNHEQAIFRENYAEKHAIFRDILLRAANDALPSDPLKLVALRGGARRTKE